MKFSVIFLFLFLSILHVFPEETRIYGFIPGAESREIRLSTFTDQITNAELILDRTLVDSLGYFEFTVDLKHTIVTFIDVEFYTYTLYVEPGGSYTFRCDTANIDDQFRPYYKKETLLSLELSEPNSKLNHLINSFNGTYNEFVIENFDAIYKQRQRKLISEFEQDTQQLFDTIENQYFKNYIEYKIASLELSGYSVKKPVLFEKYFKSRPVLYYNTEYMYFFNQFFDRHITSNNRFITRNDLIVTINDLQSYEALTDTLGKDSLLRDEVIRELVMLKGLKKLYYIHGFERNSVINVLQQVVIKSKFEEHRIIAKSTIKELKKLELGTFAPDFTLMNLDGGEVRLSDYYGKTVYLSFLTTWSYACLAEYEILSKLENDFGDKIVFLTVSFDHDTAVINRFRKEKNYEWSILYNGTNYDLMKQYEIKTFPLFVMIDSRGRISQYPGRKPSENVRYNFQQILGLVEEE